MKALEKNKLHRIRSLQELSYVKYLLEYDVAMKEKAIVASLKGIRYTLVESARQSLLEYGKKLIQVTLMTIFNKIRNRKEESETEK